MLKKLLIHFFGYKIGQVVTLADFDEKTCVVNNTIFSAYDARKGKFCYWITQNGDLNRYVIARKYRI